MIYDTLLPLSLAMIVFVGGHFLLSAAPIRAALVGRLGQGPFLLIYSAIALVSFVYACYAFTHSPVIPLWDKAVWSWYLALALMPFACIFLVAGAAGGNPTVVGSERLFEDTEAPNPAQGIFRITRHPVMWAIAIWSALHLLATGDAAAVMLFGGILILSLAGMAHIDARRAASGGEGWARFTQGTSTIPFVAILRGRSRVTLGDIGYGRIVIGLVLYVVLVYGHEAVIGLNILPGAIKEGV